MKKDVTHRIAYYLKKVNQKMSVHPAKLPPRSHTYRTERLMLYKKLMHEQIADKYPALSKKYMG
ncbi:hypothetical protein V7152_14805 [Neobacillus drentensis]|uniref:hypothetical protein n=1 Tax=Neobacillus drentensis TaxID=220684 RepID=UPI002FFF9D6F